MSYYPVYLRLNNELCVVVGGGSVAFRKVKTLLEYGGRIRLVSKSVIPELEKLLKEKELEYRNKSFSPDDLSEAFLVIGATDASDVNALIYKSASEKSLLVNIVDSPSECNFIVPSIVRQGDLCISISTGGKSPALAKKMRKQLQKEFGSEFAVFLEIMGELRPKVIKSNPEISSRMNIFSQVVESDALELIKMGRKDEAREKIEHMLGLKAG